MRATIRNPKDMTLAGRSGLSEPPFPEGIQDAAVYCVWECQNTHEADSQTFPALVCCFHTVALQACLQIMTNRDSELTLRKGGGNICSFLLSSLRGKVFDPDPSATLLHRLVAINRLPHRRKKGLVYMNSVTRQECSNPVSYTHLTLPTKA